MTRGRLVAAILGAAGLLALYLLWPETAGVPPVVTPVQAVTPKPVTRNEVEPIRPPVRLPRADLSDAGQLLRCELSGRVVSVTRQEGIVGAELSLKHQGAVTSVRTGPKGFFEFQTTSEGNWTLAAIIAPGFHPYAPQWGHSPFELHLRRGVRVGGLRFVLTAQVDYRGRVVGPDEAPISGAEISVLGGDRALLGPASTRVSDAEGRFVFQAEDEAVVVARHPRYLTSRETVDFAVTITHELKLKMEPLAPDAGPRGRGQLRGSVVDDKRVPVPSALVTASSSGGEAEVEGLTDADGRFAFEVEAGDWWVTARDEGRVPASTSADVPGKAVELVLERGRIRGTVADSHGHPVSAFAVLVRTRDGPLERGEATVHSVIDGHGAFVVEGLAAGAYSVSAQATGLSPSSEVNVDVPALGEATAQIILGRGGAVAGRVVSRKSGSPLEHARVALESESETPTRALQIAGGEARTIGDGSFVLDGVPVHRVSLLVSADHHHARLLSAIEVKEGETTQVGTIDLGQLEKDENPRIELVGIGAVLRAEGDVLVVLEVMPGSGASEVGLRPDDALVTIDGEQTAALGFAGGVERIRGAENSSVHLRVRRGEATIELDVPRRRVVTP